jgi:hypothetical protein
LHFLCAPRTTSLRIGINQIQSATTDPELARRLEWRGSTSNLMGVVPGDTTSTSQLRQDPRFISLLQRLEISCTIDIHARCLPWIWATMTRSFIPHYFDAGRRARPAMSVESLPNPPRTRTISLTTFASNTRSSVLPSVLPYLRKLDIGSDMSVTKPPLLTLKLSSDSFLDCTITSDATGDELYYVQTDGPATTISRFDSWEAPTKVIEVKWPKASLTKGKGDEGESILVQVRGGRWKFADSILLSGNSLLR